MSEMIYAKSAQGELKIGFKLLSKRKIRFSFR
jgi:hypothetical protein